jgi:hypothetical protein
MVNEVLASQQGRLRILTKAQEFNARGGCMHILGIAGNA